MIGCDCTVLEESTSATVSNIEKLSFSQASLRTAVRVCYLYIYITAKPAALQLRWALFWLGQGPPPVVCSQASAMTLLKTHSQKVTSVMYQHGAPNSSFLFLHRIYDCSVLVPICPSAKQYRTPGYHKTARKCRF